MAADIEGVARKLGLTVADLIPYGRNKAKLPLPLLDTVGSPGKLILVTAITPTPAGEGASDVVFTREARGAMKRIEQLRYGHLPVCMSKTPSSLSDDPKVQGRPRDFEVTVQAVKINAGAGFLVVLLGNIMRMPGLPRRPQAYDVDLVDGEIVGVE